MTPDTDQPFTLGQMAGSPRRRRTGLVVGIAVGSVLLVGAAVPFAVSRHHAAVSTAQQTSSPAAPAGANAAAVTTPAETVNAVTTPAAPPSPTRTPSETCSDSAAWDQEGGAALLDAYINNQDSGNINVDDMKSGCPQYLPVWQKAQGGIPDGSSFAVPADVKPGTYETTSSDLEGCYWERSRKGQIIANNFITASKVKQRVTIRSTDDTFVTRDCGNWVKVG